MEIFKILGTIAIENQDAKDELNELSNKAEQTEQSLDDVDDSAKRLSSGGFSVLKGAAAQLIANGFQRLCSAMGQLISSGAEYQMEMEQYTTSFETMTGSAEKAAEVTEQLGEIAASTPFELTTLADTTQLLMNYGFTADDAIDKMMMLGDISQGSSDKMNRVAAAYGQMSSAGKVSLEDVKQMIEAGFNPLQEISESTGESMESLYARISNGTISVDEITASMQRSTEEGGKYFGAMDAQSETLSGRLSTLKDTANESIGNILGGLLEKAADEWIPKLTEAVEGVDEKFQAFKEKLVAVSDWLTEHQTTVETFAIIIGAFAAAWGLVNGAIAIWNGICAVASVVTTAFGTAMTVLTSPITLVIVAIGALIAVIVLCVKHWDEISAKVQEVWSNIVAWITEAIESVKAKIAEWKESLSAKFNEIKENLTQKFKEIKENLSAKLEEIKANISEKFTAVFDFISTTWTNIREGIAEKISEIKENLAAKFEEIRANIEEKITATKDKIVEIWDGIVLAISTAITLAWETIVSVFTAVYEFVSAIWTSIRDWIATKFEEIRAEIEEKITAAKDKMVEIWTNIKEFVAQTISDMKANLVEKFTAIKNSISEKLTAAKEIVMSIWSNIRDGVAERISAVKENLAEKFDTIKSNITDKLTAAKETVTGIFDEIKGNIEDKITAAKDKVNEVVETIKGIFDFTWSLPSLKLPHFSYSGSFSLNPPSVPKFYISWYKKAMDKPMILDDPTIFGMGQNGQLLGGGEAGDEVVAGANTLMDMISAAVEQKTSEQTERLITVMTAVLEAIQSGNREMIQAMLAGHEIVWREREVARLVRTYA